MHGLLPLPMNAETIAKYHLMEAQRQGRQGTTHDVNLRLPLLALDKRALRFASWAVSSSKNG